MDDEADLTVWLRPKRGGEVDAAGAHSLSMQSPRARTYLARAQLAEATASDPADVELLRAYLARHKVRVVETIWRCVVVRGTLSALASAFDATLELYVDSEKRPFRQRSGTMSLPAEVANVVRGVFGFNEWPRAHSLRPNAPSEHAAASGSPAHPGLLASAVGRDYAFPEKADGAGQTIAILQFGGSFARKDFEAGMKLNGVAPAEVIGKRVDGALEARQGETEFDIELALDTQIVGALAPGARLVLYAAPHSERGFLDAVRTALFDDELRPAICRSAMAGLRIFGRRPRSRFSTSCSRRPHCWASACFRRQATAEPTRSTESPTFARPHRAVSSTRAAGRTPSSRPARSSKKTLGTTPAVASARAAHRRQTGIHEAAEMPDGKPSRGVPDVAAQVVPGYRIVHDGKEMPIGGTSAVAPLWAALAAR